MHGAGDRNCLGSRSLQQRPKRASTAMPGRDRNQVKFAKWAVILKVSAPEKADVLKKIRDATKWCRLGGRQYETLKMQKVSKHRVEVTWPRPISEETCTRFFKSALGPDKWRSQVLWPAGVSGTEAVIPDRCPSSEQVQLRLTFAKAEKKEEQKAEKKEEKGANEKKKKEKGEDKEKEKEKKKPKMKPSVKKKPASMKPFVQGSDSDSDDNSDSEPDPAPPKKVPKKKSSDSDSDDNSDSEPDPAP